MIGLFRLVSSLLFFVLLSCQADHQSFYLFEKNVPCRIVLDLGAYHDLTAALQLDESGEEAGRDARLRAFAAVELRHHLSRITGQAEKDIAIVDDDTAASGNLIFIGSPGQRSPHKRVRAEMQRRWKRVKAAEPTGIRIDAFQDDRGNNILALSGRSAVGSLHAVYEWLDEQGVRWLAPGEANTVVPFQPRIHVPAGGMYRQPAMNVRGFLPGCEEYPQEKTKTIEMLDWLARQRVVLYPALGGTAAEMNRRGLQRVMIKRPESQTGEGFCISRDDLVAETVDQSLHGFTAAPGIAIVAVDLSQTQWCQCAVCGKHGNACDKSLFLLSQIGLALKQKIKENKAPGTAKIFAVIGLQTPAHFNQQAWPKETVRLSLRVSPRCYDHALDDPFCQEVNQPILRTLAAWSKAGQFGQLGVVEGYQSPDFWSLPLVLTRRLQEDAAVYQNLGFKGLMSEPPNFASAGIRAWMNYQFVRLAWRSTADSDSLSREFFAFYYAGADKVMSEYGKMIEEAFGNITSWRVELAQRAGEVALGGFEQPLFPLSRFEEHFNLAKPWAETSIGTDWERTYQLIHDARHLMDGALAMALPDQTVDHLLEAEKELQFAEMTISLYDNLIRVLTLGEDEPEMREEAAIRLLELRQKMAGYSMTGHPCGAANALSASGIEEVCRLLGARLDKKYSRYNQRYN